MKLPKACPNCERIARRLAQQDAENATLKAQLAQALARITQLAQQLAAARKDSSTSSKPPSSDIVKPEKPLPQGGTSLGGRIADEAKVAGLVCLGYPFHPIGKPDQLRVAHLKTLRTPALIVQGERDPFGNRPLRQGQANSRPKAARRTLCCY